jgi:hypothetical protein
MNHQQILGDIVAALKGELGEGYSTIGNFVQNQGRLLAKQAEDIARSRLEGSLAGDDELFQFFLEGLERNAENMTRSIVMLTALTIEKAWNAVAGILWGAIRSILGGAGVPGHLLPQTPPFNM